MKRFTIALLALLPLTLFGANGQQVIDGYLEPAGYVQVSSVSSAVTLGTIPDGTKLTLIQAQTVDVRWRDDGTNPTAAIGMLLEAGQTLVYNGNPSAVRVIETAASAKLNITFYR